MQALDLSNMLSAGSKVLCLGAHCDDIDIGCGATLRRLQRKVPQLHIEWLVFAGNETREAETRASAARLAGPDRPWQVTVERFKNGYFPSERAALKDYFEGLKARTAPDLILTHYRQDQHQDHRVISELTWNTFRDHWILEYEIPKYDGDLGNPGVFVEATGEDLESKIAALMASYPSQADKAWFDAEVFRGLARLRGVQCQRRYAEAFYLHKLLCV